MSFACVRVIWTAQTRCDVNRKTGLPLLFAAAIASTALALEVAAKPTNQGNSQGSGSRANKGNGHGSPSNCAAISSPASGASVRPREPRANSANRSGRHGRSTSLAPSDCDALANASASSATGPASGSQSGNGQGNNGNAQGNGGQSGNGNGQGSNVNGEGNGGQSGSGNGQANNGTGQGNGSQSGNGSGQGSGSQGNNGNGQGNGGSQGNGGNGVGSATPAPAPAYCSAAGSHPWNLAVGNVTIGATAAKDCWGVVTKDNWSNQANPFGNDSAGTINLSSLFGFDDWTFVVRDPSGSGPPSPGSFGGVTWALTGNGDGTWSLQTSDPPPAEIRVDFIAVLKGSDSWAGWFFDDFLFSVPSTTDGSWTIAWNSNGGQTAGFSHMSLYMRDAWVPTPPTNTACTGLACSNNVPEPGTLALLAFGAFGIGALRRRGKLPESKRVGG